MTAGPLLLIAAAGLAAGIVMGRAQPRLWLALTLVATTAGLLAAGTILLGAPAWEWRSGFDFAGEEFHLRLDGVSSFFLALLSLIGGLGAAYSHEYWTDERYPKSAGRGRMWWSALVLSMGMVLLSSNGLHFLIAWELFAVSSYFLITLDRQRRDVRAAGWLFFAASHFGTLCLFAFFAAIAAHHGTWELGPMRDDPATAWLFWLALAGFGLKAGLFPLHIWLPSAHANAPSHVSAILSGVSIKMGLYGLVRFSGWLPVPAAAGWVVLGLGAAGALLGIAFALGQNDYKRLLAYSSVENMGIIAIGLGAALVAAPPEDAGWARLALAGALLHAWNHGLFKSLLFFSAGSVLHATGTREMSRLGGLWRTMPWTAALFLLGAVAVCALPPLNGFVSEWLIYVGLFDAVTSHGSAAWAAMPAIIVLGMTGALALATFAKAGAIIFLGAPRTRRVAHAHESGPWMRGPMLVLAAGCVAVALAPLAFWPAVARAVGAWRPAWEASEPPAAFASLGPVQLTLALAGVTVAMALWERGRHRGVRRALTWDCGYALPSARMQYTSGSFGGLATGWFGWILQPERTLRRPRGLFPREALALQRVPETVLERVMTPVGGVILQVSAAARRLQHGRLQFYIFYVVVGLAALAALVLFGSMR
ncbi:MAG: proton-conducting transporter membrane subunit [Opitutaceae bacterium]|nr:proton-conducting transporter membrane subunit [Opitutaceae bacterium]